MEDVRQLKKMSELLFNAFTLSSQIWAFKDRKDAISFFCDVVFDDETCTALVVSDKSGDYYRMDEDVMECKFLDYIPKVFKIVDSSHCECSGMQHRYLAIFPVSRDTAVYIYLKEFEEDRIQILKEMVSVLSRALEHLEMQEEKEQIVEQLRENLYHFQFLADRLRNPLAVIQGVAEVVDDIGVEKALEMIMRSVQKMKEVLDDLAEAETSSLKIYGKCSKW